MARESHGCQIIYHDRETRLVCVATERLEIARRYFFVAEMDAPNSPDYIKLSRRHIHTHTHTHARTHIHIYIYWKCK